MTENLRPPEIQPPHPSDKFTFEEALAAVETVMEKQRLRELRRQAREARKVLHAADSGEDP